MLGSSESKNIDSLKVPFADVFTLTLINNVASGDNFCGQVIGVLLSLHWVKENLVNSLLSRETFNSCVPLFSITHWKSVVESL